jgi:hypothetical protein
MRRLVIAAIAGTVVVGGCADSGGSSAGKSSDGQAILSVMSRARTALLADDASQVCSLLTAHGRARALGFRVDYDDDGRIPATDPRLPQSCEAIVKRLYADAHRSNVDVSWPADLRNSRFLVRSLNGRNARCSSRSRSLTARWWTSRCLRHRAGGALMTRMACPPDTDATSLRSRRR